MRTGIKDRNGREIHNGDMVSLAGNMTADDSMGYLPNGWVFDEYDVYEVYFDPRIDKWSLKLGCEPDTDYNRKYMSHAVRLLHDGAVEVVDEPLLKQPQTMNTDDPELQRACRVVERHCRAIGKDCQIIFTTNGVELAPLGWAGSIVEDDLYSAIHYALEHPQP